MMMRMIMKHKKINNSMDSQFFEILNKRSHFEQVVSYRRSFKLPTYDSDIDSIDYFLKHGYENNRFRKRYDEAMDLAKDISDYFKKVTPGGFTNKV
jgi:hypothetical protein